MDHKVLHCNRCLLHKTDASDQGLLFYIANFQFLKWTQISHIQAYSPNSLTLWKDTNFLSWHRKFVRAALESDCCRILVHLSSLFYNIMPRWSCIDLTKFLKLVRSTVFKVCIFSRIENVAFRWVFLLIWNCTFITHM